MACIAALFVVAMLWENPFCLSAILVLVAALGGSSARKAATLSMGLALVYGAVNAFMSGSVGEALWRSRELPIIGQLQITAEGLITGLSSGLKIVLAVAVCALAGEILDPDDTISSLSRIAPKSAMMATLAILLAPRMKRDLQRKMDVMRCRGMMPDAGGPLKRIRAAGPLLHSLLVSSLEGAWDIGITLHCRAFGSGRRTRSVKRPWLRSDSVIVFCSVISSAIVLGGSASRDIVPVGFSRVSPSARETVVAVIVLSLLVSSIKLCRSRNAKFDRDG